MFGFIGDNSRFEVGIYECTFYRKNSLIPVDYDEYDSLVYAINLGHTVHVVPSRYQKDEVDKSLEIFDEIYDDNEEEVTYFHTKDDVFILRYKNTFGSSLDGKGEFNSELDEYGNDFVYTLGNSYVKNIFEQIKDMLLINLCGRDFMRNISLPLLFKFNYTWDSYAGDGDVHVMFCGVLDYQKVLEKVGVVESDDIFIGNNLLRESHEKDKEYWENMGNEMSDHFDKE